MQFFSSTEKYIIRVKNAVAAPKFRLQLSTWLGFAFVNSEKKRESERHRERERQREEERQTETARKAERGRETETGGETNRD